MPKRRRKTPRRKRQHPHVGSAMMLDRRQAPERRAAEISGKTYLASAGEYYVEDGNCE